MNGLTTYLFCKYSPATVFICLAMISSTIFASSELQTGASSEIARYTLQREKTTEPATLLLQNKPAPEIEVVEHSGVYQIKTVAVIRAPARHVRHVLTDFMHIYRLNPSIIESDVLKQHDDDSVNVRTKVIGCAAYFCEELERVEKVYMLPSGDLYAEIIPELSQFKSGHTYWRIKEVDNHCEVTYESEMDPDVFIPPIVGKFLIKKSIREQMQISFANLEKIASIQAEREWQENYHPEPTVFASSTPCSDYAESSLNATQAANAD